MKKKTFNKLELNLYEETLENGFKIYVVPVPNVANSYVTLSTKYGSIEREFVPYDGNKMICVPDGIAHFLEHKMFEQKNGVDPFTFFGERGADANANTTNFKTTYLFSGTKYLEENLNYLLDYVYNPYFTDENVEKEKGIIDQEMKMYEDDPYSVLYENLVYNTFVNHPIKIKVIGNHDSVYSITKEDLYTCYNTFYHPSNMFLVATGNVEPSNIINIVKDNMAKKEFHPKKKIKIKKYDEPNSVSKKHDSIKMNINIPKVGIGYKINIKDFNLSKNKIYNYIYLFFDIKFGPTSLLNENLIKAGIVKDDLSTTGLGVDDYRCIYIFAETKNTKKIFELINEETKNRKVTKEEFERKKKAIISSLILTSDNVYSINNQIMNNIVKDGRVETNIYNMIRNLDYDEFIDIIERLDLNNYLTYVVEPN